MQVYRDRFYLYESLLFVFIGSLFLVHSYQSNFPDKGEYQVAAFMFVLGVAGHSYFSYSGLYVKDKHLVYRKLLATTSIAFEDIAELRLDAYKKATTVFLSQDLLFFDKEGQVLLRVPTEILGRKKTREFLKLILSKKPQINRCNKVNSLLTLNSPENPLPWGRK